jgi:hypothetical protein
MKRRGGLWMVAAPVLAAALLAGLVAMRSSSAHDGRDDNRGFSNRTIKGHWGFNTSFGMLVPPAASPAVPTTGVGRIHFDGDGGCQVTTFANINGDVLKLESSSCRYSVSADGFGTSEAVFPGAPVPGPVPVAFVIVDRGNELRFMNTRFIVGTFTATRQ